MQADIINVGLGFLEGFALIISPCILPILPIVLAGSLSGSKTRPFGIITGFVLIFSLFTFFSRKLVQVTGIDLNMIRHLSFGLLFLLGVIMLSSYLTQKFSQLTQGLTNAAGKLSASHQAQEGLMSGMLFGGLIAIVWTPCAGPILAAVIVQTVISQTNLISFLTVVAFGAGAAIPMLLISIFGQDIMTRLHFFKNHGLAFRKSLGAIIILSVVYMIHSEIIINTASSAGLTFNENEALSLEKGLYKPYPAPQIGGIEAWINSKPLQLKALKGNVVLIDFWTYSCINCIRTLPYLKAWYDHYHDKGLIIIGIHSPEFGFEKNLANVTRAVKQDGLKYPVALDNQFITWQNFKNSYWPAHYLIDKKGNVVYTHLGEGDYDVTENNIQYLLGLVEPRVSTPVDEEGAGFFETPETYLGYARADHFAQRESLVKDSVAQYTFPAKLSQDAWALQGRWKIMSEGILAEQANAAIKIYFHAHKVYIVMGSTTGQPIQVKLLFNNKAIAVSEQGEDVVNSNIKVTNQTLYKAVALSNADNGELEVISSAPGLELYTFTFGD